jgi:hypothetical protein
VLSFHVVNLLIPDDPEGIELTLPSGTWTLERHPQFAEFKQAMAGGQSAETYILEHQAATDRAFEELTPILLAASYLTGLSVTIRRSTMGSEVAIMQPSDHWPRARAMDRPSPVIATAAEFKELVERFVQAWPGAGRTEKARLLVHHWLDALACWSMEDLYLSATTLLQVIVATEAARQRKKRLDFYPGVEDAANHIGIRIPSNDFKNMRNELIHDGQLIGARFAGPDKKACAAVVADILNWFDEYVHAALRLGAPRATRFRKADLMGLNAYSID